MIAIIDYGMGNLGSILNMLRKIGADAVVSSRIPDIEKAGKLILPGVGAFDAGMTNLHEKNLVSVLNQKVLEDKTPVLGICLGMQLMTRRSEEGRLGGLEWIDAETRKFRFEGDQNRLKIPHMGWNYVKYREGSRLFDGAGDNPRFYFLHSYHVVCHKTEDVSATTNYGYDFVSALERNNIFAVQFHPEKSHKFGMKLLGNFAGRTPC